MEMVFGTRLGKKCLCLPLSNRYYASPCPGLDDLNTYASDCKVRNQSPREFSQKMTSYISSLNCCECGFLLCYHTSVSEPALILENKLTDFVRTDYFLDSYFLNSFSPSVCNYCALYALLCLDNSLCDETALARRGTCSHTKQINS